MEGPGDGKAGLPLAETPSRVLLPAISLLLKEVTSLPSVSLGYGFIFDNSLKANCLLPRVLQDNGLLPLDVSGGPWAHGVASEVTSVNGVILQTRVIISHVKE